jgi:hypothetical protein
MSTCSTKQEIGRADDQTIPNDDNLYPPLSVRQLSKQTSQSLTFIDSMVRPKSDFSGTSTGRIQFSWSPPQRSRSYRREPSFLATALTDKDRQKQYP